MTRYAAVECPAKVNLALHVLGRRDDGYHELDTVFQAVDLWDRLEIRDAAELELTCDRPDLPVDGSNLVVRAARALAEAVGVAPRGALHLAKSIPTQGGMGGGSSDAAAALVLCARFWGVDPGLEALMRIGAGLGADVPFFLVGGSARGTGRGDRIEPLEPLPETALLLGLPPFGVPTPDVFRRLAARLTCPDNDVSVAARSGVKWPIRKDFAAVANDLEEVVFEGWPELSELRDALLGAGALRALLSGSGSTVYGIFEGEGHAARAAEAIRGSFRGWNLLPTRTVAGGVRWLAEP